MKTMTRRQFLGRGALLACGAGVITPLLGGSFLSQAGADCLADLGHLPSGSPILVTVNLFGGNDGINTVVPLDANEFAQYEALRPNLKLPRRWLLELDKGAGSLPRVALNPGMVELAGLFRTDRVVAVLNGVSPPARVTSGLFDHEGSQANLQTGLLSGSGFTAPPSGWVGRLNDRLAQGDETSIVGTDFGGGTLMVTGNSYRPLSLSSLASFQVRIDLGDEEVVRTYYRQIQQLVGQFTGVAESNRRIRARMVNLADELRCRTDPYPPLVDTYPADGLGPVLLDIAKLIWGRTPIQTYAVGLGGFDTHANQNAGAEDQDSGYVLGEHDRLLAHVSQALTAFYRDLQAHGVARDVVILVVSEFGRRANSNNDAGTDHGFAAPVFAIGEKVKGGVYQPYPSLKDLWVDDYDTEHFSESGNLKQTTDFRRVYEHILVHHFGVPRPEIYGGGNLLPDDRELGPQLAQDFL